MKTVIKIFAALTMLFATSSFAAAQNSLVKHINQDEFRAQICDFVQSATWQYKGKKPCVIDFYATWCGPCRTISPFLDKLSVKYKDQIDVYKIDVDKNRDLAQAFGATSIPLLIFVPVNGEPQANRGALPEAELENAIKTVLLKK